MENLVDEFEDAMTRRLLGNVLNVWARRMQMRDAERYILAKAARRTMVSSIDTWLRKAYVLYGYFPDV